MRPAWLPVACLLLACDALTGKSQPQPEPATKAQTPPAVATKKPTDHPLAHKDPEKRVPQIDAARQAEFRAAIKQARKLMADKKYPEAIAAYDTALLAVPGFPRGLSGRGYAKLLSGDLDGADRDLKAALDKAPESKLRSAVAFNLGLLAEKRSDAATAQKWFLEAHTLRPGKATLARLGGLDKEQACSVTRPNTAGTTYPDWLALWRDLSASARAAGVADKENDLVGPVPADAAAARKLLLDDLEAAPGPWIVEWQYYPVEQEPNASERDPGMCPFGHVFVIPGAGGELTAFRLHWPDKDSWDGVGCGIEDYVDAEALPGPPMAARLDHHVMGRDIVDDECAADDDDCIRTAVIMIVESTTTVYAGTPPRAALSVRTYRDDDDAAGPRKLEVSAGRVTLRGEGCDLDLPLTP